MPDDRLRVAMLCRDGRSSRLMYHGLKSLASIECIIIEDDTSTWDLVRRRLRKLGFVTTAGQLLFMVCNKVHAYASRPRIRQIIQESGMEDGPFPAELVTHVRNMNSQEVMERLRQLGPEAVVVNGTRILSREILGSVPVPFLNTHVGMTPR
jgi:phosphoribosylglycinamide formyltransferase-1